MAESTQTSAGGIAGVIERVLSVGIPAYVDLQQAKYRVNDPTLGIQNPDGSYSPAGQGAFGSSLGGVQPWMLIAGALALVGLVIALRK